MGVITRDQIENIASGIIRRDIAKHNVSDYRMRGKPITSDENLYIVSQRKLEMINQVQKIMKEASFDCSLNYNDNIELPYNRDIICLNYDYKNRDDMNSYLYSQDIEDTTDIVELDQEDFISIIYQKFEFPRGSGKFYWKLQSLQPSQRQFIYNKNPTKLVRTPKPVGEIKVVNNKKKLVFFKKKSKKSLSKSKK